MGESVPRGTEPDLFTPDAALDFENSLGTRLKVPHLFRDPDCFGAETRRERVRAYLVVNGYEWAIAGRGPNGKPETWGELFERVYGEPLHFAKRKPVTGPKVGLDR